MIAVYLRPRTLDDARRLLAEHAGARPIAGGTDLMVRVRAGLEAPALVSLRALAELRGIACDGALAVGATTTVADLAADPRVIAGWPAIVAAARALGSMQIRNLATVGGNLCNASPCADLAPPLLVHGARLVIEGADGRREIAIEDFFAGPGQTRLVRGELLTGIRVERPAPAERAVFLKRGRVAMDIAIASVALAARVEGGRLSAVRIAAGSVAPTPVRLRRAEAALEGRAASADALADAGAAAAAEAAPIDDVRASAEYRRKLLAVLVRRAAAAVAGGAT